MHLSIANLSPAPLLPGSFSPAPSCNAPLLIITCLQHCVRSPARPPAAASWKQGCPTQPHGHQHTPRGEGRPFLHCCKATTCPKGDRKGRRVPAADRLDQVIASYRTALPKPGMREDAVLSLSNMSLQRVHLEKSTIPSSLKILLTVTGTGVLYLILQGQCTLGALGCSGPEAPFIYPLLPHPNYA